MFELINEAFGVDFAASLVEAAERYNESQRNVYVVTDKDGNVVSNGSTVVSFRGKVAEFIGVERGPEYNGTAKVTVRWIIDQFTASYYASVFDLTVTPV